MNVSFDIKTRAVESMVLKATAHHKRLIMTGVKPFIVVASEGDRVEIESFARRLTRFVGLAANVICIDAATFDRQLARGDDPYAVMITDGENIGKGTQTSLCRTELHPPVFIVVTRIHPAKLVSRKVWTDQFRGLFAGVETWPTIGERDRRDYVKLFIAGVEHRAREFGVAAPLTDAQARDMIRSLPTDAGKGAREFVSLGMRAFDAMREHGLTRITAHAALASITGNPPDYILAAASQLQ